MEVKGISIKNSQEWVVQEHGNDAWKKLVDALPEDSKAEVSEYSIFTGKWYPVKVFEDVNRYIIDTWAAGDHRIIFKIARAGAVKNLKGVYRIFMKVASPTYVVKKSAVMYRQFYNYGEMKVVDPSPGKMVLELHDVPEQTIIFERIAGYIEGVLIATRAEDPVAQFDYNKAEKKVVFTITYK